MPCQRTNSGNCLTVFWHSNFLGYLWMSRETLPSLVLFKLDLQTTFRLVGFPANTSPGLIMECAAFVGWRPKVWRTTKHLCGTWSYSQGFLLLYVISQVEVSVWFILVQIVTVTWLLADTSFFLAVTTYVVMSCCCNSVFSSIWMWLKCWFTVSSVYFVMLQYAEGGLTY